MKRLLCLLMCAALALGLAACSGSSAPETEKAAELKVQYDFYEKSVAKLRSGMSITPEQADEVFIALVSVGVNGDITNTNQKTDGTYSINWLGSVGCDVELTDGVVAEIRRGVDVLYPPERATATLNAQAVDNVTMLIEGLTPESSRSDYEAAQAAYDDLSKSLKKQITENLVSKLTEYDLSTMTIESSVDSAIEKAGATKDNVMIGNGVVSIYLKGTESLTTAAVRRGMFYEARDILKVLQEREEVTRIALFWTYPLVDKLGNEKEESVMKIQLEKETLQSINFDKFDWNNFPDIADDYFEHTALLN